MAYGIYKFPKLGNDNLKLIQLLKIIFNFAGGIRLNFEAIYFIISPNISLSTCKAIAFIHAIVFFIYRSSLILCLFYKVKLLCELKNSLYLGLSLIILRVIFQIIDIVLIKPEIESSICRPNLLNNSITTWLYVIMDFIIELLLSYLVIRFMNKAKKSIKNEMINNSKASNSTLISYKNSFKIYNSIIFWFMIRIIIALFLNVITSLNTTSISKMNVALISTFNIIICIIMSIVLTYSKDIIKYLSNVQSSPYQNNLL